MNFYLNQGAVNDEIKPGEIDVGFLKMFKVEILSPVKNKKG